MCSVGLYFGFFFWYELLCFRYVVVVSFFARCVFVLFFCLDCLFVDVSFCLLAWSSS